MPRLYNRTTIARLPAVARKDDGNWCRRLLDSLRSLARTPSIRGNKNIELVAASPQPTQYQLFTTPTSLRPSVASGATPSLRPQRSGVEQTHVNCCKVAAGRQLGSPPAGGRRRPAATFTHPPPVCTSSADIGHFWEGQTGRTDSPQ